MRRRVFGRQGRGLGIANQQRQIYEMIEVLTMYCDKRSFHGALLKVEATD